MKRIFSSYAGLPTSIYILFGARVINSMGNFVFPFLTLFLTQKMGFTAQQVGFYVMLSSIAVIPGNFVGGFIADKFGRKWILVAVQFLSACCLIPCGFLGRSSLVPWLLILSLIFSNAARPVSSAMVADLTCGDQRKKAFSLLYLGINIGFSIGPAISGLLFQNHIRWIFWGDALTTLLSLIPVVLFVKETIPGSVQCNEAATVPKEEIPDDEAVHKGSTWAALMKKPLLLLFCCICAIMNFVYAQHTFTLPMFMNDIFGSRGAAYFGYLMTVNGLVVVFLTTLTSEVTHRFNPAANSAIAAIFYAVGFGILYFIRSFPLFALSTALWTIGEILITTNNSVYIAQHTPASHRGRFNAILPVISGAGFMLGPVVIGSVIPGLGLRNVWVVAFILSAVSVGLMSMLRYFEKVKQESPSHTTDTITPDAT